MRRIVRTIDLTNKYVGQVTSILLLVIAAVIFYEVIMRGFFGMPTIWAHVLSGMLFGASFMLGAAYILYYNEHTRVDILVMHFSPRTVALVDVFTQTLALLFCVVTIQKAWIFAIQAWVRMDTHTSSAWHPVLWPIKFVFVIGIALLILQFLAKYLRDFYLLFTGKILKTGSEPK